MNSPSLSLLHSSQTQCFHSSGGDIFREGLRSSSALLKTVDGEGRSFPSWKATVSSNREVKGYGEERRVGKRSSYLLRSRGLGKGLSIAIALDQLHRGRKLVFVH